MYLSEVNISSQDLAIWWTKNLMILILVGMAVAIAYQSLKGHETVCAPASYEGRTVTNCISK